jgi:hypothetical protein
MSNPRQVKHESTAAAFEVRNARTGEIRSAGRIAVAKAYEEMLAVYRMHGTDCCNPSRLMEYYYEAKDTWVSAERALQRLTLEQMIHMARGNPRYYRVVVFDYAGRRIVLDTVNVQIREGR